MATIHLLALGDISGPDTTDLLCKHLWQYRKEQGIDFVIANAENASTGNALDEATAHRLLVSGVDVITTGNHVWKWRNLYDMLDEGRSVIRPANYPSCAPGVGYTRFVCGGETFLVINVMGVVFMEPLDDPFAAVEKILEQEKGNYRFAVMDIHAEATSEKLAIANAFDGRIHAMFGTHTHVQTADERLLPKGSAYITDLGMCGPVDSILGIRTDIILKKFKTKMPLRFEFAEGKPLFCGASIYFDTEKGCATKIVRENIEFF